MKKLITFISITAAALMLSSCIIVGPDRDPEIVIEKKTTTEVSSDTSSGSSSSTTTTVTTPVQEQKYSIICKNQTSFVITDWCVKRDNIVTYANSGFNRSIRAGGEDMIMDLPEGYYKVYFSFEDDYPLNPTDYYNSESIYLNKDVTYCLYERQITASTECRSAGSAKQFYLAGSDGSEIDLVKAVEQLQKKVKHCLDFQEQCFIIES